jgi:hypothetical protein
MAGTKMSFTRFIEVNCAMKSIENWGLKWERGQGQISSGSIDSQMVCNASEKSE